MMLLNLCLGTFVTTVGFWILLGGDLQGVVAGWILVAGGFLWWKARSITEVWAWTTLVLGLESFAWPLQRMIQLKRATETPSNDEMGEILSAVILGLFSSVFWISFSYGLFKRAGGKGTDSPNGSKPMEPSSRPPDRKNTR
jgi:hypothetical protein